MELSALLALVIGALTVTSQVAALTSSDASTVFNAFNKAFLYTSGNTVYYKAALNRGDADGNWAAALDILGAEDAYETTGDPDKKTLVNNLLNTWISLNPQPWDHVNFNDDIGWYTLALIRGYRITGNPTFLTAAKYGFNLAFNRGWDTKYNGGGIWWCQPETCNADKEPLSNDSLGKVACMIYQSTHDTDYLNKAQIIYNWVRNNLYNQKTGEMNHGISTSGVIDTASAAYNQGTWLDFANLLYEITGNRTIYNDAQKILDYGRNSLTVNGIYSTKDATLNTWADEMARGAAHFIGDNRLWDTYWPWMVQNANSILANRRSDLGITWNAWDTPTPINNKDIVNHYVSAVAWLQFTPVNKPDFRGGIHYITNQQTGLAIDSAGAFGSGNPVIQWALNNDSNQRWQLTQNSDTSWNIINLSTWESLDCPGGSTANNATMIQWQPHRNDNQRWWVDVQSDGSYKIWNKQSGKALDGASSRTNGAPLIQSDWNGGSHQRWILH